MSEHKCHCCGGEDEAVITYCKGDIDENSQIKNEKRLLIFASISYLALVLVGHFVTLAFIWYLYLALYLLCGYSVIKTAVKSILSKDFFNEFTLMFLATFVAIIIKQMPEAVGVMLFYRLGEFLQELAVEKSKKSIAELLLSKPDTANLLNGDETLVIKVEDIKIGQKFLVKVGEKIPTDAFVIKGTTQIDISSLTGEFLPVDVSENDEILGGCINIGNVIIVEAIREFADTAVAKTIELVESSVKHKAPTEKFITKFARYYTPLVFVLSAMVAVIPPLIFGMSWDESIYRALVMLVISCPCALVISIPLGYFAAIGAASRNGVLIKGGMVVDAAKDVDMVIFDKTGTLTKGELRVAHLYPEDGISEKELVDLAAFVEQFSNHPVAKAIVSYAKDTPKLDKNAEVKDFAGKGVRVKSGDNIYIGGNAKLLADNAIIFEENKIIGTQVYFAKNGVYKGSIVLNDAIKENAQSTVEFLKLQNIKTFMLTGDNDKTAQYVAEKLMLDGYKAELLPEQKLNETNELKKKYRIMFVGDGINDAPVLSSVHIGVAMGGLGAKLTVEVSDAVILNDDIAKIPYLIRLAKKTNVIVWQNIVMALSVKTLFMGLGVVGLSGLWEAVFADVGVSLLAIFNSLRLLKK